MPASDWQRCAMLAMLHHAHNLYVCCPIERTYEDGDPLCTFTAHPLLLTSSSQTSTEASHGVALPMYGSWPPALHLVAHPSKSTVTQ
jgi:hypothetical protein